MTGPGVPVTSEFRVTPSYAELRSYDLSYGESYGDRVTVTVAITP